MGFSSDTEVDGHSNAIETLSGMMPLGLEHLAPVSDKKNSFSPYSNAGLKVVLRPRQCVLHMCHSARVHVPYRYRGLLDPLAVWALARERCKVYPYECVLPTYRGTLTPLPFKIHTAYMCQLKSKLLICIIRTGCR